MPASALYAWQALGNSVYHLNPGGVHALLLRRPALDRNQGVSYINVIYIHQKEFYYDMYIIDQFRFEIFIISLGNVS